MERLHEAVLIRSVKITNFQKHRSFTLTFDKHYNVIVGRSDSGKSSILRACKWAALNDPDGVAFIHKGEDFAEVTLKAERQVTRHRGKVNTYQLDDQPPLEALGRGGVPEEVSKTLNLANINFSDQWDALWWFSLTSGKVSKELNGIVNLSLIDDTLHNLVGDLRKAKAEVTITQGRLATAKTQRDALAWVEDANTKLGNIEKLDKEIAELASKRFQLVELTKGLKRSVGRTEGLQQAATALQRAVELASQVETLEKQLSGLNLVVNHLKRADTLWTRKQAEVADLQEKMKVLVQDGCPLCGQPIPTP